MKFLFEGRPSDSPFVEALWRTESEGGGSFISVAESHWGIVVTRQVGRTYLTVRGPETGARPAPVPVDAEFFGISFKLGTFMPHLPARDLVNGETNLPEASSKSFYLKGAAWELPTFENADTFIDRLVREGLLVRDPDVDAVLQGQLHRQLGEMSLRSIQQIGRAS